MRTHGVGATGATGGTTPETPAFRELAGSYVRLLADLPVRFTALVVGPQGGALLSTSRAHVQAARAASLAVFAPLELEAAAYAVQEARCWPSDWSRWVAAKEAGGWRLTAAEALGGARGLVDALARARRTSPPAEPTITLGCMLRALELELVALVLDDSCAPQAHEVTL